jgi:hypothetical protein
LRRAAASAALAAAVAGCLYSLSGGGGLPRHIRTVAVLPLDNQTTQFTLTQEVSQALLDAAEAQAHAIVRGRILSYRDEPSVFRGQAGAEIVQQDQRRVTVTIAVELYDAVEDRILWQAGSLSAVGEYRITEGEDRGRGIAIENLVRKVIDGAQSQW